MQAKARSYGLTPRALADLEDIWRYSATTWSLAQAESYIDDLSAAFSQLAATPAMARERPEFSPPVRIHVCREHLIVYRVEDERILIIRILGGMSDWQAVLRRLD